MRRRVGLALLCSAAIAGPAHAGPAESLSFWDLKPGQLRILVASPQVMVTRTASGWEAYCRCPVVLKPNEIPEAMKKAIIAVEDRRFMEHGGVDLVALAAVLRGGLSRGGSTIPMQLLKNLVFHDLQGRDLFSKLERKGSEVWHAGTFDGAVGKQELLAAYLNQIEFGGREIVGLYRASRYYFHKEPRDLNLFECALLAGMVQAPARFNPVKETTKERAYERARLVLGLMVQQGKISQAERLRAERVGVRPGLLPEFRIQAQPFTEWIVQTLAPRFVQEGETIRFFVTLEPRFQRLAEKQLSDMVGEGTIPAEYEAGAVMMSGDGRVRAMIGSVDWSRRQFNAAVKTSVQPGSTAKLPLIVAACEAGLSPQSRVVDRPITATWPANGHLGYKGETTLLEAMASSRNAAAVRLTQDLGVRRVAAVSRRLGIEPGPDPDAGFVLGSFSTNVLSMTAAYATVANGGYRVAPTGVLAVVDGRGQVRASFLDPIRTRVIPQNCVAPTRSILREVVRSGTGRSAGLGRWAAYGKTGTSTGNADAWFVGWSEGRVLGVWMGRRRDAVGEGLAGKGAPAEYFRRVSSSANEMVEYRIAQQRGKAGSRTAGGPDRQKAANPQKAPEHRPVHASLAPRLDGPEAIRLNAAPRPPLRPFREAVPWLRDEDEDLSPW
ncbi:transglycosylase domain-containing protein [Methylobacterium nodulans]|uniref:peptidoglycan glycosyltransferase n=1 Tax=Methylobacterium nodulans (strain LMG 21967 / CNCM I-2342 / ORS 2060) TaxID=460265 RepID=B8I9J5_METNO|nr:transglycosylase domain-containing protein [Methylobacterium nodulans]ACL55248.1 glycosyl transferase family 51 [Methylobacterium nodulans ORS 2060]